MTREELLALPATIKAPQVAKALDVSTVTVYKMIREGTLPVPMHRMGQNFKFPTAPLLEYLGIRDEGSDPTPPVQGESMRTPKGKVIVSTKNYRYKGRSVLGADLIAGARIFGVGA
ncbi:hypothetical protein H483_0117670 [Dietzia sp. UCD-THP]|nr:hypothetical protein H483_0117670 [Dietzia sp. UCD-THP]